MRETLVDVMRHGEPMGGRRYRGNGVDDPLSPVGWTQMRHALGDSAPWDQIISSPMARCRLFASELAGRHGLPLAIEPGFIEVGMGAWEGRSHADIAASERRPTRPSSGIPLVAVRPAPSRWIGCSLVSPTSTNVRSSLIPDAIC